MVKWIGFINTDLHDYDLLKQKSVLQEQQIKGLQAISSSQKSISIRQNIKIEGYVNGMMKQQTENYLLSGQLKTKSKKAFWRGVENWIWRGGAVVFILKSFRVF